MKTIFLHGLGQSAGDWQPVTRLLACPWQPVTRLLACPPAEIDCPELFSWAEPGQLTYPRLLAGLERCCGAQQQPFRLCGLSLGAVLALDYAIRHPDGPAAPASLVLAGVQYKIPTRTIDLQNLLFRLMPRRVFAGMGVSKQDFIRLAHSMRTLDLSRGLRRVVCGEKDAANLKASRQLARLLPGADLHILPGAGHELNACAPQAFADVLRKQA